MDLAANTSRPCPGPNDQPSVSTCPCERPSFLLWPLPPIQDICTRRGDTAWLAGWSALGQLGADARQNTRPTPSRDRHGEPSPHYSRYDISIQRPQSGSRMETRIYSVRSARQRWLAPYMLHSVCQSTIPSLTLHTPLSFVQFPLHVLSCLSFPLSPLSQPSISPRRVPRAFAPVAGVTLSPAPHHALGKSPAVIRRLSRLPVSCPRQAVCLRAFLPLCCLQGPRLPQLSTSCRCWHAP